MSRDKRNAEPQHANVLAPDRPSFRQRVFKLVIPILLVTFPVITLFGHVSESAHVVLAYVKSSSAQTNALPITDWPYDQIRPAIAFNGLVDDYFVVWQHQPRADSDAWYIFGRKIDVSGFPNDSPLAISESNALAHIAPDVAYHEGNQEYIVVWEYVWTEMDHDIHARRLDSSGEVIGGEISISSLNNKEESPVVEPNSSDGEYLVMWSQKIGSDVFGWGRITGRRLNAFGVPTGTLISIGEGFNDQLHPELAYNSHQNRYLVVWQEQSVGGDFDIMGQMIAGNGDLIGETIEIDGSEADQLFPQVAFNPDSHQYLVVWEDHSRDAEGAWDIRGQRLNTDGALVGSRLPIAETYLYHRLHPDVTYKSGAREYIVVWENQFQTDDHDIFQRRIASDGSFNDVARSLSISDRFESRPVIASDDTAGFVTAWEQDNSDDETGIDIYAIQADVSVTPAIPTPTQTATASPSSTPTSTSQPMATIWLPMVLR